MKLIILVNPLLYIIQFGICNNIFSFSASPYPTNWAAKGTTS